MFQYETIEDMQKRFTRIVNHLASLGKIFPNEDLINKVLRCLSRQWQPKVKEMEEKKNISLPENAYRELKAGEEYQPIMSTKNPHTKAPAVRPAEKATWHAG